MKINSSPIIIALDFADINDARSFVAQLQPEQCRLKVGKEMFTRFGPAFVKELVALGFDVFLDLKFHDIPNTVANACKAAAELGVWMITVHALGGRQMLEAAHKALEVSSGTKPHVVAVTLLTHLTQEGLSEIGLNGSLVHHATLLAKLAFDCQLDGIVCSAQEAKHMRLHFGPKFLLVTPGIRMPEDENHDQSRVMTPSKAIHAGANYLVIGRPITRASNPVDSLRKIQSDITTMSSSSR